MNRLTEHFFKTSHPVFTNADVSTSVPGSDYSRHGLVKRAIAEGEILNIRRGLYCLAPPYRKGPVSVFAVSQRVYGPSYVSMETALSYHGWIPEAVYACTCASFHNGKDFDTPLGLFSYKRVPQKTFFAEVERRVDQDDNVFFMASPAKALADYVYVHRVNWAGIDEAVGSLRIEPEQLLSVSPEELAELTENYTNGRVKRFLKGWHNALS